MGNDIQCVPTTQITTEYLMTYVAPLDPPLMIDDEMMIVNVRSGGWVNGPKISGKFLSPGADWLRIMPSGAFRLDVRGLIKTDDDAHIYISYNGIIKNSDSSVTKLNDGELLTYKDIPYFITAPTFQTSAENYAWLNDLQTVGKMVEIQFGEAGYVKYDVFVIQ